MADVLRSKVLWFGSQPGLDVGRELRNRGLRHMQLDATPTVGDLCGARGAVFSFDAGNTSTLSALAVEFATSLIDYGLRVELIATDDVVLGRAQAALRGTAGIRNVHARTAPESHEVAERLARHDPGPQPNARLEIQMASNREPIRDQDRPLFQRAFHDCRKIVLSELSGGRSHARVFSVHPTLDNSVAGAWPQPFFVKLDNAEKVIKEGENYHVYAPFVPFGLRPSISGQVLGSTRGLLIGDFADRSESLWERARRNVASTAISSLFEITLGGWRAQGYAIDEVKGSVAKALELARFCTPSRIKTSFLEYAKSRGVRATPDQLWTTLCSLEQTYRVAPIHGDLHGHNVRVRDGHAILIDFASVGAGPLTTDLAALETWLAFELPPEEAGQDYENEPWRDVVDRLYAPTTFLHPPEPCDPTSPYCWMTPVVRQIRHLGIAVQSCPTEYEAAVAVSLLRRCMWSDGCAADRFRRAHAYVIAAQLTMDLRARLNPPL
jgi:phosphotransferase family enzyme